MNSAQLALFPCPERTLSPGYARGFIASICDADRLTITGDKLACWRNGYTVADAQRIAVAAGYMTQEEAVQCPP